MDTDPILDVDLDAFERGSAQQRRAVVDGTMSSLASGFVFARHGLDEVLLDEAYAMLEQFFGLDGATKLQYAVAGTHGSRGYTGLGVETAAGHDAADWKEMLSWGTELAERHPLRLRYPSQYSANVFPEQHVPGITSVLTALRTGVLELQRRFLRIVAVGVQADESFFDALLADGNTLSRAIHYPPMSSAPAGGRHLWSAPHADINLLTALPRATSAGLQVRVGGGGDQPGRWVDAAPPEGYAVLNAGIMLERLTNGVVPAGFHRVLSPQDGIERYSVVQFCHPSSWSSLAPLQSCVTPGRPQRWPGITAGELLDQVLWEINMTAD